MTSLALPEEYARPDRAVLVVPHAGGGAAVANPLRAALPESCLVAGVRFGGRESRFADPPPATLDELVDDVVSAGTELADLVGRPPVVVGQCSGALLAYLAAARRPEAFAALVAVSRPAPSWPGVLPDVTAGDEDFLAEVVAVGGVPDEVAAMPELLELLLPSLRADFTALSRWTPADSTPVLGRPILTVRAADDHNCPAESVLAWDRHGTSVRHAELDGSHFLLSANPRGVAGLLGEPVLTEGRGDAGAA